MEAVLVMGDEMGLPENEHLRRNMLTGSIMREAQNARITKKRGVQIAISHIAAFAIRYWTSVLLAILAALGT